MLVQKVKARVLQKKTRTVFVEKVRITTVRPETLGMNCILKTEVKKARQQSISNKSDNYCDPWEVRSSH